jgi:hypothetical protein
VPMSRVVLGHGHGPGGGQLSPPSRYDIWSMCPVDSPVPIYFDVLEMYVFSAGIAERRSISLESDPSPSGRLSALVFRRRPAGFGGRHLSWIGLLRNLLTSIFRAAVEPLVLSQE